MITARRLFVSYILMTFLFVICVLDQFRKAEEQIVQIDRKLGTLNSRLTNEHIILEQNSENIEKNRQKSENNHRKLVKYSKNIAEMMFTRSPFIREEPVRIWDGKQDLIHLHIGKSGGGTSLDSIIKRGIENWLDCYIGFHHFDWSYIQARHPDANVLTMFREPVSRAISHFHYSKGSNKDWARKLKNQSISQFLRDPKAMMKFRDVWYDGQASVAWVAGTHIANWVAVGYSKNGGERGLRERELSEEGKEKREIENSHVEHILTRAADRVENMFWFGILEDLDRSLELLQHQLNLTKPIEQFHKNDGRKRTEKPVIETDVIDRLASLTPQDTWLYNFAKTVFEARWNYYKTGKYVEPVRPKFPELPCRSTRYILSCVGGPYEDLVYVDPKTPKQHLLTFDDLL